MSDSARHSTRKHPWLVGALIILLVVGFVLAAGTLYTLMPYDDGTRALRAKGYPTTIEELEAWYPEPPESENAAEYYLQAGAILGRSGALHPNVIPLLIEVQRLPWDRPLSDETRSRVAEFLEREAAAFETLDEASQFEHSRYPAEEVIGTVLSQYMFDIRYAQRLRALYYSRVGDAEQAVEQFETLAHWTRSTGFEPSVSAVSMFSIYASDTVEAAHQIINTNALSREQYVRMDRSLALLQRSELLLRAIIGDRCTTLDRLARYGRFRSFRDVTRIFYCEASDAFLAIAEEGLPDALESYRTLHNRQHSEFATRTGLIFPAFDVAVSRFYKTYAEVLATRAAIAIQLYRLAGNELPDRIEDLPAETFNDWNADPFSGRPLIYRRMPEGFIVYSVGSNFEDDGGRIGDRSDAGIQVFR